jgi:hypothetical protein
MKNENIKNVLILIGIFVFVLGVSCLINNNSNNFNMLENFEQEDENFTEHIKHLDKKEHKDDSTEEDNEDEDEDKKIKTIEKMTGAPTDSVQPGCLPKDQLMPQELLPQDNAANQWSQVNPQGAGTLMDKNLLQAGHHVGINTVGQTLRNANMQLRSDPPNPQVQVSPWIQSTINPDTNRKPFEIGGSA